MSDEVRESTIRSYRSLCTSCGCANERELTRFLAREKKPRRCPVARLLRACGQLQVGTDITLPDCLTAGKATREVSWFALLEHIRHRVAAQDGAPERAGLSEQDEPGQSGSGPSSLSSPARPAASDPVLVSPSAQVAHSQHSSQQTCAGSLRQGRASMYRETLDHHPNEA